MQQNYEQLVDRIAKEAGLDKTEIDRKVEAKRAKLSGLISKEGAAQVVAAELGISFEKQKMKITELVQGMRGVNVVVKIINLFPVRSFDKNGRSGKVVNMIIADDTGNMKMVLWDINHIALFENNKIKQGDIVEIKNGSIRNNELHLGSFSEIKISSENLTEVKTEISYLEKKIKDIGIGNAVKIRGIIVQIFEPRSFEICPECRKKVSLEGECETHGKVSPIKRFLLNFVVDDGTESLRIVLFNEHMEKLKLSDEELNSSELFLKKREELLGKEAFFSGTIRKNKMFNNPELFIEDIKEVDIDELIKELETKGK